MITPDKYSEQDVLEASLKFAGYKTLTKSNYFPAQDRFSTTDPIANYIVMMLEENQFFELINLPKGYFRKGYELIKPLENVVGRIPANIEYALRESNIWINLSLKRPDLNEKENYLVYWQLKET